MKIVISKTTNPYFPKSSENHPVVSVRCNRDWYKALEKTENSIEIYKLLPLQKDDGITKILVDLFFVEGKTVESQLEFLQTSISSIRLTMDSYSFEFWEIQWPDFFEIGDENFCKNIIEILKEVFGETEVIISLFEKVTDDDQ